MDEEPRRSGEVVPFPAATLPAVEMAIEELELVYAFIYARVGNKADAEDLTQQVAMKAIPRLRNDAPVASIRAYLFATARSVLATFWSTKFGLPEEELHEESVFAPPPEEIGSAGTDARVGRILDRLPANYRRVLELRFLRGYSLKEVAAEVGSTVGGIKVMQLRALRAAAKLEPDA